MTNEYKIGMETAKEDFTIRGVEFIKMIIGETPRSNYSIDYDLGYYDMAVKLIDENSFKQEIASYIISLGGNNEDIEQIIDEVKESGFTTMEEVKAHIDNYYQ